MLNILRRKSSEIECRNLLALHDGSLWDLAVILERKAQLVSCKECKGYFSRKIQPQPS